MSDIVLREYQLDGVQGLREGIANGHRSQLLVAPTGAGKTIIAVHLMNEAQRKGTPTAFMVDRIVLVDQTSKVLDEYGIDHGVIQSGHWRYRPSALVQVCSAQTIEKRGFFPGCKLLVVDEAHVVRKQTADLIMNREGLRVVGLTATPFPKGLGQLYTNLVNVTTTRKLQEDGFLVDLIPYAAKAADMTGAKTVAGEWSDAEAEERGMKIIGDILKEWTEKTELHFGGPVKTIVFSATVDHGAEICKQFQAAGHNFQQISYKDRNDEYRRELIEEFRRPNSSIMGLVACEVLTKGFDVPDVLCGIAARPYRKSLSSHIQQLGRVLRPSPGKKEALWLCIAEDSPVLTNRGEVPIQDVRADDLLWDGVEWVRHEGVIYKGEQEVITYAGLTATPGHHVWTETGWRPLGDCALEQAAIACTGIGGSAVREREGYFAGPSVAGPEDPSSGPRDLRVRDLRAAIGHFARELAEGAHAWVRRLQRATARVSDLAVRASAKHEAPLHQPEELAMAGVRGARHRVSVQRGEGRHALDHGQLGRSGGSLSGVGPQGQRRALRAGQSALGVAPAEPDESAKYLRRSGSDASIPRGLSERQVCGRDDPSIAGHGAVGRGDCKPVRESAVEKTKRPVWDILNAGPRNRFTASGLLVHNCHAGNYLRFFKDTMEVFENGVKELSDKGLDEKIRGTEEEKQVEKPKCHACGFSMPIGADVCPACGAKRMRRSMVENVAGTMVLIGSKMQPASGKYAYLADRDAVWRQLCYLALARKAGDPVLSQKYAQAKYMSIYGEFARRRIDPMVTEKPSQELVNRITHDNIAHARRRAA